MKVFSITEARKMLGERINQVKYGKQTIALGKNGRADVLLVALNQENEDVPATDMNAESASFRFLEQDPDLYSVDDLKQRYV